MKEQDKRIEVFGVTIDNEAGGIVIGRERIDTASTLDHGHDPIGGDPFMFRMVPSGDIVDEAERKRRMDAYNRARNSRS